MTEGNAILVAGIIAGLIAYLTSLISKDIKTSEFRQAWIDDIRQDISDLIAQSVAIRGIKALQLSSAALTMPQALESAKPHFEKITVAKCKIMLRLNPKEKYCKRISRDIAALEKLTDDWTNLNQDASKKLEAAIADNAQLMLKKEWGRVKRGEPLFFITKLVALGLLIASVLLWIALNFYPDRLPEKIKKALTSEQAK
jgi:hypothetical protein